MALPYNLDLLSNQLVALAKHEKDLENVLSLHGYIKQIMYPSKF